MVWLWEAPYHHCDNIFIEHLKKLALDSAQNTSNPSLWLRYVDDTFVIWPHGLTQL
jgi:hypothetical protein